MEEAVKYENIPHLPPRFEVGIQNACRKELTVKKMMCLPVYRMIYQGVEIKMYLTVE